MSLYLSTLVQAAEEHSSNVTLYAWGTGVVTIVILGGLLLALISFGGGREHS